MSKRAGGGEYPAQDGFGWTNGVARALSAQEPHSARWRESDSPSKEETSRSRCA
jgi:alpha,alpha-trehalase